MDKQERWVFRLPSNEEGDKFLKDVHKYLNKDSYKVSRMFTGPRPKGTNPSSTLKTNATSSRVYVDSKRAEDNINPYEYIQRGRNIEKGLQAFKNAKVADSAADAKGLVVQIYETLGCAEPQTMHIIRKLLEDITLFDKKQHDYGPQNIAKFGTTGVLVRSSDKVERLINLYKRVEQPEVAEPISETWQDLSVYGAIARVYEDGNWEE